MTGREYKKETKKTNKRDERRERQGSKLDFKANVTKVIAYSKIPCL